MSAAITSKHLKDWFENITWILFEMITCWTADGDNWNGNGYSKNDASFPL